MKIVESSFEIYWRMSGADMLKFIEAAGRTAYKSEAKITEESAEAFVRKLISRGHFSVLEHISVSARVVCDRGISHEIVRHRLASYTQESTRFCNYSKDKFGEEITVIEPSFTMDSDDAVVGARIVWRQAMEHCERVYFGLLNAGAKSQIARSVLPTSLKTELVMTLNLRAWRHFFFLRTAPAAHPDMRRITIPMLEEFKRHVPVIFDTLEE